MGDLPVPGGDPNSWGTKLNTFLTDIPVGSITGALGEYGPLQNMRAGIANVLDYGAVGDGTHDDTSAIRDAIAAAGVGGVIWLPPPPHIYRVSGAALEPLSNQTFKGGGNLKYGHAAGRVSRIHKPSPNGPIFSIQSKVGVSFDGLVLTGSVSLSDPTEMGIAGDNSSWVSIHNCHLWGFGGPAVKSERTSEGVAWDLRGCLITASVMANDGLSDYVGAVDLTTHDNILIGNELGAANINSVDYDYRAACVIRSDANFIYSNMFELSAVGLVFRESLGKCIANSVIGNRADLNFYEGFQLVGADHQIIGNRSFRNGRAAHATYDGFVSSAIRSSFIGNGVIGRDVVDAALQMRHGFTDTSLVSDGSSNSYIGNIAGNIAGSLYNISDPDNQVIDFRSRPANADTSGATLGQIEIEVNEIKALLRAQGLMKS